MYIIGVHRELPRPGYAVSTFSPPLAARVSSRARSVPSTRTGSTHVPSTVNAVSTISCTAPVASLQIWTDLFYESVLYATGYNANARRSFIQTNAANTCVPGYYQNVAEGFVVAPPGYTPPSGWIGNSSPLVLVNCLV